MVVISFDDYKPEEDLEEKLTIVATENGDGTTNQK